VPLSLGKSRLAGRGANPDRSPYPLRRWEPLCAKKEGGEIGRDDDADSPETRKLALLPLPLCSLHETVPGDGRAAGQIHAGG